ncbi:ABC transporter ATP-binding protein [Myxococcus sp. CA051A]|uniref:ABC transporter ATP-binding protein n=1 Tax=Myxococcus llanfairpwllgwyngyllgogerychwyrndrobwllllantysiliogogogochensis TaxID=2590453 RepID=A0A540WHY1_9BACT|nr:MULTISPECIES: ABC transporter ATP-binding protein [Myxococcus]NTX05308.1 ABC transporter ATP-binding protein [Myxococcus sp. CA040A]NTX09933.1 ABC transporter ATP-binding protein [Myxococcus sp. CA056]NTX35296.1 ABC transporter ATP-binding protein [Myxococcus sp. CA033]NTX57043.1 ABC transporter ATP-binding protein [Myxococcus sp. CA039A]NTX64395.1 ABC transporter ATP-binding protein [Myxococcus sp. CA051A]
MSTPTPALELTGLTKRYGDFTALQQMDLTIQPGEIFALLGPNGAGKTTMIGSVCGLVRKTAGTIRVFGKDLDQDPVGPRYQLGLVPQEINFDPFFTVAESLRIQLGFYGQRQDEARVDEVLTALNLHTKKDSLTRALSGGMKRRLLIAKALVHKPKLVFLDEPTAGVDVELRRDLWTYVRKLASEGTTILLTTHYLEEAEELADRVGIINEGRLLMVENKATLLRRFGEKRVVVTFQEPQTTLSEATRRFTPRLSEDGRSLTYVEREGVAPAGDLLRVLYAEGLPIADVETRRSRLEDVLLEVLRGRPSPQAA